MMHERIVANMALTLQPLEWTLGLTRGNVLLMFLWLYLISLIVSFSSTASTTYSCYCYNYHYLTFTTQLNG